MSTSLLTHGFGLSDLKYDKTEYREGKIYFHVKTKKERLRCGNCKSKKHIKRGFKERQFRTVPIGLKPVYLVMKVQRLECRECGSIQQEYLSFVKKKDFYEEIRSLRD